MRQIILAFFIFLILNVSISHGCSEEDEEYLEGLLDNPQPNGLKLVDQAGRYIERVNAMKLYNSKARQRKCNTKGNDWQTEQDHMPPKSTLANANGHLAAALFGKGEDDMLAMTYLRKWHRPAGTTGSFSGCKKIHELITKTINAEDVVLTYKLAVLSSNPRNDKNNHDLLSSTKRDFTMYMNLYIQRVENYKKKTLMSAQDKTDIINFTTNVLPNAKKTFDNDAWKKLGKEFTDGAALSAFNKKEHLC